MFANRFYAVVSGSMLRIFSHLARLGTGHFSNVFVGRGPCRVGFLFLGRKVARNFEGGVR